MNQSNSAFYASKATSHEFWYYTPTRLNCDQKLFKLKYIISRLIEDAKFVFDGFETISWLSIFDLSFTFFSLQWACYERNGQNMQFSEIDKILIFQKYVKMAYLMRLVLTDASTYRDGFIVIL